MTNLAYKYVKWDNWVKMCNLWHSVLWNNHDLNIDQNTSGRLFFPTNTRYNVCYNCFISSLAKSVKQRKNIKKGKDHKQISSLLLTLRKSPKIGQDEAHSQVSMTSMMSVTYSGLLCWLTTTTPERSRRALPAMKLPNKKGLIELSWQKAGQRNMTDVRGNYFVWCARL